MEKIEEIDIILGNNEKKDIVKYVEYQVEAMLRRCKNQHNNIPVQTKLEKLYHIEDIMHQKEYIDFGSTIHMDNTRAVVKVQDGCDRFCSYCIIPYARGRVKSRKIESIIDEIVCLADKGVKEVVITGIHIASYGKDFKEDIKLIDLLEKINEIRGIERIRLGSLEPTVITKEFVERLVKVNKICHHFHLSLQSANDETLKRMNRKYTIEEFKGVVDLLRNTYIDVILTTDIIVGFPGETEEEFNETYKNLEKIKFYKMHIFKYSRRKGTKADLMENQIPPKKQEERSKKLIKLSDINQNEYNKKFIGKNEVVLFEEIDNGYIKGHTQNYIKVKVQFDSTENYHNQLKKVKIKEVIGEELIGEIV